jgi:hypothetical protein
MTRAKTHQRKHIESDAGASAGAGATDMSLDAVEAPPTDSEDEDYIPYVRPHEFESIHVPFVTKQPKQKSSPSTQRTTKRRSPQKKKKQIHIDSNPSNNDSNSNSNSNSTSTSTSNVITADQHALRKQISTERLTAALHSTLDLSCSEREPNGIVAALSQLKKLLINNIEQYIGPTTEADRKLLNKHACIQRNYEIQCEQIWLDHQYELILEQKQQQQNEHWTQEMEQIYIDKLNTVDEAQDLLAEESDEIETICKQNKLTIICRYF